MSNQALLVQIRNTLAYLYSDEASARRIAADAGLDSTKIAFSALAMNNWHAILGEAVKTGRLEPLLACVQAEYESNAAFQTVYGAYREITADGGRIEWVLPAPDGEEPPAPGESPYKGLRFFDVRDAAIFFGREALIAELVGYLRDHRFLAVVGASGSGKSSVVRAGLVPALQRGEPLLGDLLPPVGSEQWPVHIITPKAHPLKELAATLTREGASPLTQAKLMDELAADARVLDLCVSQLLSGQPADRLLLVVDQFEELFTLCKEQTERKAFIDNLLTAAVEDGVTTVVITLRADFYSNCFAFDNLRSALGNYQVPIGPMNQDELRRAIEEPARLGNWRFEPGLVDLLLQDVGSEPGALPLLSHALLETWQRRQGRRMTLAGYQAAGRVQGAIAKTADRIYQQELDATEQRIARHIFLSLTELGEGAADTRRRVALDQLVTTAAQRAQVDAVLAELTKARLVITGEEAIPDTDTEHRAHAEVAHEALIREWPRLRRWLEENRESLRLQRNLEDAAKHWQALGRDTGALYSGIRLQQALAWQRETDLVLTSQETAFLRASKRRRDFWRGLGVTVVLAVFAVLGWLSWGQVNELRYEQLTQAVPPLIDEGNAAEAKAKLRAAAALFPDRLDLEARLADVNRQVATQLVQQGETLAREGDLAGADANFRAALALEPPPDTPVYVWVPAGEFMMGSGDEDGLAYDDEKPPHPVDVGGFWLMRTEVTNAQYRRCVGENEEGPCTPPDNEVWQREEFTNRPVTDVTWEQAQVYAAWVGGRLPTEAEWEKTCRGGSEIPVNPQKAWEDMKANPYPQRIYPWGNGEPHPDLLNYYGSQIGTTTDVGRYLNGASPYGVLDMGGNVFEWTGSVFKEYPYDPNDGHEEPASSELRVVRGGSFVYLRDSVRCAFRDDLHPDDHALNVGFRILSPGP